jgi:hypothetical protein
LEGGEGIRSLVAARDDYLTPPDAKKKVPFGHGALSRVLGN